MVTENGSGYASREQPEIIKTTHAAFRPIDVKMGPDGALYIADWYNPIIQHGEVDFRDERRDHTHGRIWRVTFKDRSLVERPQLVDAPMRTCSTRSAAPEDFTRLHAKLQLKARGADSARAAVGRLGRRARRLPTRSTNYQRLEALWTYQALDVVEPKLLTALLRSPEHRRARRGHARAWPPGDDDIRQRRAACWPRRSTTSIRRCGSKRFAPGRAAHARGRRTGDAGPRSPASIGFSIMRCGWRRAT